MRTRLAGLALAASLLWIGGAPRAEAQYVVSRGYTTVPQPYSGVTVVGGPVGTLNGTISGTTTIPSVAGYGRIIAPTVGGTYIPPYSYTVVPSPWPARHYQAYGPGDFPFYGRAYGRPYDAWTWPYLAGGYHNQLARYYHPPL